MEEVFKKDIVDGLGVYLTELGEYPVLLFNDHQYVFSTADNKFAWLRDGTPNTPDTRQIHGKIRFKLYNLVEATN
jgi:hypothetical protein